MRILLLLLISVSTHATEYYVRDGATGSSGTDWTGGNALDTIAAALALANRGDTVWVADGTYLGPAFNEAESGTSRITIKKAIAADHGTSTGWLDSYGDGTAEFQAFTMTTGYYTIDGQTGGGPDNWEGPFGFKFNNDQTVGVVGFPPATIAPGIILRHFEVDGGEVGPSNERGIIFSGVSGFQMSHFYIHDIGCDLLSANYLTGPTLFEYGKFARNHQAEPGCHGDVLEYQIGDTSDITFRYCNFEDIVGSYAFGSHGPTITGYNIYGNFFYWTTEPFFGNFLIGCLSMDGIINDLEFVNNTLGGAITSDAQVSIGTLRGTGNKAYNNIWYRSTGSGFTLSWGNTTHASNTAYNGSGSADQNLTGNPFVNFPTDPSLLVNSTDGTDYSTLFTEDAFGDGFDLAGVWTRGFKAFSSDPPPPSGGAPNAYGVTARVGSIRAP